MILKLASLKSSHVRIGQDKYRLCLSFVYDEVCVVMVMKRMKKISTMFGFEGDGGKQICKISWVRGCVVGAY